MHTSVANHTIVLFTWERGLGLLNNPNENISLRENNRNRTMGRI